MRVIPTIAIFCLASVSASASIITIDFEEVQLPGADDALLSKGFVLDPGLLDWTPDADEWDWVGHYHIGEGGNFSADNGTKYIVVDYFNDDASTLNVNSRSGAIFGVKSLDIGEAWYVYPPEFETCFTGPGSEVTFTGSLAGGGTISTLVTVDGICDGSGPLVDFETFEFDGRWNRLTSLTIQGDFADFYGGMGIDNIVLRVPEPGTLALLGIGLAGMGLAIRRKASA